MLGEDAEPQPAVVGDAAGVRVLQLGEHPDEGRLAVTVAADDTDPVALGHSEGYTVEQGTVPYTLLTCSTLTRLTAISLLPRG